MVQMADEVRELVTAKVLNLFEPWPLKAAYDVIFCRNVMIYFGDPAKEELEERFVNQSPRARTSISGIRAADRPGGTASMRSCGHTIYQKPETH